MTTTVHFTPTLTINMGAAKLTHAQFQEMCETNRDLRLELSSVGELTILAPTGWGSSKRNLKLIVQVGNSNDRTQLGEAFDSSGGLILPNGAQRSPDVAWVEKSRLDAIDSDPNKFLPLAPDFLIELRSLEKVLHLGKPQDRTFRSATDSLPKLQEKMQEYQANGVRLGWLIDPQNQRVEIYRLDKEPEILQSPTQLSGEDILPGFTLDLTTIW